MPRITPPRVACAVSVGDRETRGVAAVGLAGLGQPEVEHLDRAVDAEHDVGRFEVAVYDALLVRGLEGFGDLKRDCDRFLDWHRSALDSLGKVLALDEFHTKESDHEPVILSGGVAKQRRTPTWPRLGLGPRSGSGARLARDDRGRSRDRTKSQCSDD